MSIIADVNAIPNKFYSQEYKQISDSGKNRIETALHLNHQFDSNRDETINAIFQTALADCIRHFGKNLQLTFSHNYRRSGLDVKSNATGVFINETLLCSLSQFINLVIYHSLDFNNPEVQSYCYKQLLFVLNEQCNNTYILPIEEDYVGLIERYPSTKTLNVASDIYWGIITFLIFHELAHIFLGHLSTGKEQTIAEQEHEADSKAYNLFLEMIYRKSNYTELAFLEDYIYLASMMVIDFFTLVNFVDGTLNEKKYYSYHPPHKDRKEHLFDLFDGWECDFDTEEGNGIYNWFIEVVEKFKNDLYSANKAGQLNSIKRRRKRVMDEENIIQFVEELETEIIEANLFNGLTGNAFVHTFVDNHVCFISDQSQNDFVLIKLEKGTAHSFKLTNVIIDFKGMINSLLELALTTSVPDSPSQALKTAIFVLYKILGLSSRKINDADTQVLMFLHESNAYGRGVPEEKVLNYFKTTDALTEKDVNAAIDSLLQLKCIDMANGTINLLEKIHLR